MAAGDSFKPTDDSVLAVLAELQAREPIFHRSQFFRTSDDFARLMADGYWEVGASGRRYSRAFILEHLAQTPPVDADAERWRSEGFACRQLGQDTFLLTYTLHQGERATRRATIWKRSGDDWQILFHQGTVIAAMEDDVPPPALQP